MQSNIARISNSALQNSKHYNKSLLPTVDLLKAINAASQILLRADSWEFVAEKVLNVIGDAAKVDRIKLVKFSFDKKKQLVSQQTLFTWQDTTQFDSLLLNEDNRFILMDLYKQWLPDLYKSKTIFNPNDSLSEIEKIHLRSINVKSLIAAPVFVEGVLWGIISFEDINETREWLQGNAEVASMISNLFGSAIDGEAVLRSLKETESRFQIVSRATNDALYDWNLKEDKIWRSPNTELIFSYPKEEINNNSNWWQQNIHPNDKTRVLSKLMEVNASHTGFWSIEYYFRRGNGQYIYVLDRAYFAFDESGDPIRMIGSMQDISELKKNEVELQESRDQLRRLALRSQSIREEERKFLSRELHDEFAQILTGIKFQIEWLGQKISSDETEMQKCVKDLNGIILETMDKVRQIAMALRPNLIDDIGIVEAIEWQLSQYKEKMQYQSSFETNIGNFFLTDEMKVTVFRIFQEALSNIARHAQAKKVDVLLHVNNDILLLQVKDDGIGFSELLANNADSIGILGMKERAMAVGGTLKISRVVPSGTAIRLQIEL